MIKEVKKFFNKGLDSDTAEFLVDPNRFISGNDVRIGGTTDKGGVGYIENILRNAEKFHVIGSSGVNTRIGFAADDEQGWVIKFNYNSTGDHGVYLFDIVSETWYIVLREYYVTGGLNFQRNSLIHSARIENGCLYWCNTTLNEPRRIDIRAAVNLNHPGTFPTVDPYTSPLAQSVINWIRRQPGLPPSGVKSASSSVVVNLTKDEGFWFYYRYIYRNYEISTLSALSPLFNYNTSSDIFNFISVSIPLLEKIEQDVLQVDLCVKYANGGKSFAVKSWNRTVAADLAAINLHNAGSAALEYDFTNEIRGTALDDAYSVKPFDSLPIYVQTIEIARNRSFMGNYTIGYGTPTTTSLAATTQVQTGAGTLTGKWIVVRYNSGASTANYFYLPDFDTFYSPGPYTPPVVTVNFAFITLVATGWGNFTAYANGLYTGIVSINYEGSTSAVSGGPPVPGLAGTKAFKSGVSYQLSIHFLDHAGRKCGILSNTSLKVTIAEKIYAQVDYTTAINWTVSNALATAEIPIWACYYSVNITKCLTTRFFLDSRVKNITYANKNLTTSLYEFNTSVYAKNLNGIGIDITLLNSYGMGYTFADGDIVKVYISTNVYTLSIIAQQGNWIVAQLQNLGALGTTGSPKTDALFEVFTPYRPSVSEAHYEVAQIFPITNPTTVSRAYSVTAGTITGDVTLLTRNDGANDYLTENMSPNDKFPYQWNTDSGRPNFVDTIGQQILTNSIAYSNTIIPGAKVNGLSTFEALNTKDVPLECGDITKLEVADKISEQGNIMLAICVDETVSLYLGEAQLLGSTGNAFLAQAADVIGTINVLQGSFGSMNPESVVRHKGRIFFYSLIKGCFVSYADNGLFPISDMGLKRVTHLFSQKYASLSAAAIELLGSRPFVFGGVDPYHEEVYFSIPTTEATPPKGYLPDYVSPDLPVIYPYDIYDGQGKVLVYKIKESQWATPHTYQTEGFIDIRDYLFSAKNGAMYKHNVDDGTANTYSIWYGSSVVPSIGFLVNEEPNIVKQFLTLSVEGNYVPTFIQARTELPNIQDTDLQSQSEFTVREGIPYAPIRRDRLSPNVSGTFDQKLYTGDKMQGQWLKVLAKFQTNTLIQIRFFNIGYQVSDGHKT